MQNMEMCSPFIRIIKSIICVVLLLPLNTNHLIDWKTMQQCDVDNKCVKQKKIDMINKNINYTKVVTFFQSFRCVLVSFV